MRRHFASVLMEMCETRRLADVTVADVVAQAQTARQTFYNHFADINDLICYAAAQPMMNARDLFTDDEATLAALQQTRRHPGFFRQLAAQSGQNSVRAALNAWLLDTYRSRYLTGELAPEERAYRDVCIQAYCFGTTEVFLSWCAAGMPDPLEPLVRMYYDMTPAFVREGLSRLPGRVEDYPR